MLHKCEIFLVAAYNRAFNLFQEKRALSLITWLVRILASVESRGSDAQIAVVDIFGCYLRKQSSRTMWDNGPRSYVRLLRIAVKYLGQFFKQVRRLSSRARSALFCLLSYRWFHPPADVGMDTSARECGWLSLGRVWYYAERNLTRWSLAGAKHLLLIYEISQIEEISSWNFNRSFLSLTRLPARWAYFAPRPAISSAW